MLFLMQLLLKEQEMPQIIRNNVNEENRKQIESFLAQLELDKGLDLIKSHAKDFITKRLKPSIILNDGKQTPMKGHPVFIAQHATATCCRNCLHNWWRVRKGVPLNELQQDKIVELNIAWISAMMGGGITDHSVNGVEVVLPTDAFWPKE